jgi:hypothetical protein
MDGLDCSAKKKGGIEMPPLIVLSSHSTPQHIFFAARGVS